MDPNETLARCRQAITNYHVANNGLDIDGCTDALLELFDGFLDLDVWMSRGGARPKAWEWTNT